MKLYDSVVIGLGGSGSSALYHLAKSGRKVIGLERWTIPHKFGSSHGDSRIIRQAYFEGQFYVPFAKEAYKLWDQLEKDTDTQLFMKTKCLNISTLSDNLVGRCKEVSDLHHLKYNLKTSEEVNRVYPFFSVPNNFHCLEEENAGILFPEKCNLAHLEQAKKYKAQINFNNEVIKISHDLKSNNYEIITNQGIFYTNSIVISAGSGVIDLLKYFNINIPFSVDLNYVFYFKFRKTKQDYGTFPIYLISYDPENEFYGFPDLDNGNGFKVSLYKQHLHFDNEAKVNREHELIKIKNQINNLCIKFIRDFDGFEGQNVYDVNHLTCLYTSTPDKDFIIDYIPEHERVVLISACSGHGFKFSSRIGEHGANLINKTEKPVEQFKLNRFLH
jgi:sarcosine oxidase